jgi:hypothetical protein
MTIKFDPRLDESSQSQELAMQWAKQERRAMERSL